MGILLDPVAACDLLTLVGGNGSKSSEAWLLHSIGILGTHSNTPSYMNDSLVFDLQDGITPQQKLIAD